MLSFRELFYRQFCVGALLVLATTCCTPIVHKLEFFNVYGACMFGSVDFLLHLEIKV